MSSEERLSWFSFSGLSFVVSPGAINSCGFIVLYRPVLSLVSSSSDYSGRFILFPAITRLALLILGCAVVEQSISFCLF